LPANRIGILARLRTSHGEPTGSKTEDRIRDDEDCQYQGGDVVTAHLHIGAKRREQRHITDAYGRAGRQSD
jgi:hypothetical protein